VTQFRKKSTSKRKHIAKQRLARSATSVVEQFCDLSGIKLPAEQKAQSSRELAQILFDTIRQIEPQTPSNNETVVESVIKRVVSLVDDGKVEHLKKERPEIAARFGVLAEEYDKKLFRSS